MRSVYDIHDGDDLCVAFVPGTDVTIDPFKVRRVELDASGEPFLELHGVVFRGGSRDEELCQRLEDLIFGSGGFSERMLRELADYVTSCPQASPATSQSS